jgi:hypothetical protein
VCGGLRKGGPAEQWKCQEDPGARLLGTDLEKPWSTTATRQLRSARMNESPAATRCAVPYTWRNRSHRIAVGIVGRIARTSGFVMQFPANVVPGVVNYRDGNSSRLILTRRLAGKKSARSASSRYAKNGSIHAGTVLLALSQLATTSRETPTL